MHHFHPRRALTALLSAAAILVCLPTSAFAEGGRLINPKDGSSSSSSPSTSSSKTAKGGSIPVKTIKAYSKDYDNIPDEFLKEISRKTALTSAQFQKLAVEYQLPAQFVQRFYKDYFVFKSGDGYSFDPIDPRVPKNTYNFNNIQRTKSGEARYVVNGASKGIKGIDVSAYQGDIDWKKVKADGVKFALIRAGYRGWGTGKIMLDSKFHQNMKNASAAGVKVGVYFFSQAVNKAEAVEEAKWVLKQIKGYHLDYPVVFDIEGSSAANARTRVLTKKTATEVAAAFCDTIQKAGYRPMIYTYTKWFAEKLDLRKLAKYDKWLAQYYEVPFFPYKMQIWQYSSKGRVNGIKGDVDMNLAFTSYSRGK